MASLVLAMEKESVPSTNAQMLLSLQLSGRPNSTEGRYELNAGTSATRKSSRKDPAPLRCCHFIALYRAPWKCHDSQPCSARQYLFLSTQNPLFTNEMQKDICTLWTGSKVSRGAFQSEVEGSLVMSSEHVFEQWLPAAAIVFLHDIYE